MTTPNIVVVVFDTTRAVETVPTNPAITPTLAALAEAGTEFTNAFATAPWSLPSHASVFTGTYPSKHDAHADHTALGPALPTIAEAFRDHGYETVGCSNNVWITGEFGFDRGFETFYDNGQLTTASERRAATDPETDGADASAAPVAGRTDAGDGPRAPPQKTADKGAARSIRQLRRWLLSRDRDAPFFLFLNLLEPHLEYRPPRVFAERFLPDDWSYEEAMAIRQDPREYDVGRFDLSPDEWLVLRRLYRGELAYADLQLSRLRNLLERAGAGDETVMFVLGDHGENIGEHGFLGHQYCVYDTLLHVPMIAAGGPFSDGPRTDPALVQLLDLAPTLLDTAGIDAPLARREFQGRSFHPESDAPERDRVYAEYMAPRPPIEALEARFGELPEELYTYQRSLRAVRTKTHKYIRGSDGTEELYDLAADPDEATNVVEDAPGLADTLGTSLDDWLATFDHTTTTDTVAVDPETERQLSDLGYL